MFILDLFWGKFQILFIQISEKLEHAWKYTKCFIQSTTGRLSISVEIVHLKDNIGMHRLRFICELWYTKIEIRL